jgi:aspartate kinase
MNDIQPIIMKFGGTSLANEERIQNAARIIQARADQHPVIVTSAMSQITNTLIASAHAAHDKDEQTVKDNLALIREKHFAIVKDKDIRAEIEKLLKKLEDRCHGIMMVEELSPHTLDVVSSLGERMSSWLMVETLRNLGLKAERFDSRELVRTDGQFGGAEVQWDITCKQITEKVAPLIAQGIIPVVTGFIGSTEDGTTTTLGRGGSDYSASILGVCLGASNIQIWTDVDGMMTSDPRLIENARSLEKISFREAAELAYFGAKVLHPKTIQPAIEANIPVKILNTMKPDGKGTTILNTDEVSEHSIKAIAFKKKITVINICSTRMFGPFGFLAKIFDTFAKHEVSVDVVATTEVSVSITVEDGTFDDSLIQDLEEFSTVSVIPHQSIISVVGNGLKDDYRVEQKVFDALAKEKVPTEIVSKGASQINLTFIVKTDQVEKAVIGLHNTFFPN